jgi:hypothetical protein
MQAGLVTWQNGTRFIAPALAWLFENRKAIWIGVATALITALPFRGLWREIRIAVRNFRG